MRICAPHALIVLAGGLFTLGGCSMSCPIDDAAAMPVERHNTPITEAPIVEGEKIEGTDGTFFRAGRFIIGSQPTTDDLIAFRREGVGTVVNLRSMGEVEELDFNEGVFVGKLGMTYAGIPLGGDDGYEPADVDAFVRMMEAERGDVLVHCASGGRARAMMSAWLITRRGWTEDQAEDWRRTVGEKPGALERLLTEPDEG
ncbi:MAG: sulfur transferase domain-containing protein [Phycisphaerales bacterium]